jgi:hypothetical protein
LNKAAKAGKKDAAEGVHEAAFNFNKRMAQNEGMIYWEADEANTWQRAFLARGGGQIIERKSRALSLFFLSCDELNTLVL